MSSKREKDYRGFTLIELLVVISVIGLLSSVVLSNLSNARAKARDAQRIASVIQMSKAVEVYAADHDGWYPGYQVGEGTYMRSQDNALQGDCGYGQVGFQGGDVPSYNPGVWCKFENALAPYMSPLPRTSGGKPPYLYYVYKVPGLLSSGANPNDVRLYGLGVFLETTNNQAANDGGYYSNMFEVGGLPRYCKNRVPTASGNNQYWMAWASSPCGCDTYYTSGCGF